MDDKHAILEEIAAIEKLVSDFAARMRVKLIEKMYKGWGGWNEPDKFPTKNMEDKLKAHVERGFDFKNMIDIGNFAAMIWWRRKQEMIDRMNKKAKEFFGKEETQDGQKD